MSNLLVKSFILIFGFAVGAGLFITPSLNKLTEVKRKSEVKINEQIIVVEAVSDPKSREEGLSGRDNIGLNEGMLFLFEDAGRHGFWMKGMKFPIDIIWINSSRVVGVSENLEPRPEAEASELEIYYPPEEVNKVLEVKAGRAALMRAKAGDEVKIRPLISRN